MTRGANAEKWLLKHPAFPRTTNPRKRAVLKCRWGSSEFLWSLLAASFLREWWDQIGDYASFVVLEMFSQTRPAVPIRLHGAKEPSKVSPNHFSPWNGHLEEIHSKDSNQRTSRELFFFFQPGFKLQSVDDG